MVFFLAFAAVLTALASTSAIVVPPSEQRLKHPCHHVCSPRNKRSETKKTAGKTQELQPRQQLAAFVAFGALLVSGPGYFPQVSASAAEENVSMRFENGEVMLSDPLLSFGPDLILQRPRFLGSGGGGSVFAFSRSSDQKGDDVAVKVSWLRSAASVERECTILQVLESRKVEGVELCLGKERYPIDGRRVMIALTPVIEDNVASVSEIDEKLQLHAVHCIIRTMVQMLAAGVVTTDVQPLISQTTGDVLFIDLTEAKLIALDRPLPFLDVALSSSFCTEMLSLIPEKLCKAAATQLFKELQTIESKGVHLSDQVYDLLRSQTLFMSQESLDYIDARIGSL